MANIQQRTNRRQSNGCITRQTYITVNVTRPGAIKDSLCPTLEILCNCKSNYTDCKINFFLQGGRGKSPESGTDCTLQLQTLHVTAVGSEIDVLLYFCHDHNYGAGSEELCAWEETGRWNRNSTQLPFPPTYLFSLVKHQSVSVF